MPQLNPNPWFFIMLLSWLNFSLIIQPKLLPFIPTNSPSKKTLTTNKNNTLNFTINLSFFDQFTSPCLLGIPLILLSMLFPALLVSTPKSLTTSPLSNSDFST